MTKRLAGMFGMEGVFAGGVSMQGGSAANMTSMLIALRTVFPECKNAGVGVLRERKPTVFTSAEAHYSVRSAAALVGLGSDAVVSVPVVEATGAMDATKLKEEMWKAKKEGKSPFYVCATAGTTVRGAFDPVGEIKAVCEEFESEGNGRVWLHVDGSWGGPVVFTEREKWRVQGTEKADTVAVNPHKMMGVPITCSFLLGRDMRLFFKANKLEAGYLFHGDDEEEAVAGMEEQDEEREEESYDMAAYTPQCGRRADNLKLYLSWIYHDD